MSEILLQTIIEKLQSIEAGILKQNATIKADKLPEALYEQLHLLQKDVKTILNNDEQLQGELDRIITCHEAIKSQSFNNMVEHKHHLHKGIWAAIGMFILSVILLMGWINSNNSKRLCKSNDIKYRALKVAGSSELLKVLHQTDSLYIKNERSFEKQVEQKEQRLVDEVRLLQLANEKKRKPKN